MRILVTGVNGQLGHDVVNVLTTRGIVCKGVDVADFDLSNWEAVRVSILDYAPTAVIHCGAYTSVDRAEDEKELCFAVNVTGTENIARICKEIHAKMLYVSTDYVFDGKGDQPFETNAPKEPQSQYGMTKSLGEDKVLDYLSKYFIVRTAWVFGINGNNFVKTMIRLGKERDELSVVADQFGSPTYSADLAILLCDMIVTNRYGIYHATNEGFCSWYEFASAIMKEAGLSTKVLPVTSEQYGAKATRPKNSRLSSKSLDDAGFSRLPSWQDALRRYLEHMGGC